MLSTRLTRRFGLKYPVLSAPMTKLSGGTLAAAVSEAGGLGFFGTSGMTPEGLADQIALARSKTSRPFGCGFLTQRLPGEEAQFAVALESRLAAIWFSFEDPTAWVKRAHDAGVAAICQVQSLEGAREAAEAGADVIVAQGREAGGHTGGHSMLPLLEEVLEAFPEHIVVAAGGIASGRALAAVIAAGADGAVMGTRFAATPEAIEIPEIHKRLVVQKGAGDTILTPVYDMLRDGRWPRGVQARVYRNRVAETWTGRERELEGRLDEVRAMVEAAARENPLDHMAFHMGTSVGAIRSIEPAGEVLRAICGEAERRLRPSA